MSGKADQNKPLETIPVAETADTATAAVETAPETQTEQAEEEVQPVIVVLNNDQPGILGPMVQFPEVAEVLNAVAQRLLVDPLPGVTLSRAQRELLAGQTSIVNDTEFCMNSHTAAAEAAAGSEEALVALSSDENFLILMELAAIHAQASGHPMLGQIAERVRTAGWSNEDIHLTVAISSAFNMFNSYVDTAGNPGCNTKEEYDAIGKRLVEQGYKA